MTSNAPNTAAGSFEFGQGLLKKLAVGGGLMAAVALYLYEIVSHNPQQAFALAGQFGPGFLLGMVVLVIAWDVLKVALGHLGKLSDGMNALSVAVAKIAEKDDRQFEEMRLVAQFNSENSGRILKMTSDMGQQMQEQAKQLQEQGRQLQSISDRIGHAGAKA